jgi:antirestriction protein
MLIIFFHGIFKGEKIMSVKENADPRIYVACLAAYNDGKLHGQWINANQDADCIYEEIREMLSKSPVPNAEELAIHDLEDFCGCQIEEYADITFVAELAAFISEHGKMGAVLLQYLNFEIEQANVWMDERYCGLHDSEEDFARETMEEIYSIPDYLQNYIDYEKVARDWFLSDYVSLEVDHQVAVFNQC